LTSSTCWIAAVLPVVAAWHERFGSFQATTHYPWLTSLAEAPKMIAVSPASFQASASL
jgi:hypothetical protein